MPCVCLRACLLLARAPLRGSVRAHAREGAEGAGRRPRRAGARAHALARTRIDARIAVSAEQAMDRAHRIGQKRVVNVYRLITRNTLEEKIMGLQRFKLSIANSIVNEDNASLKNMDTSTLLDLFAPADGSGSGSAQDGSKDEAGATGGAGGGGGGMSKVLTNLEELWDESQYQEAFNIDSFVSSLK